MSRATPAVDVKEVEMAKNECPCVPAIVELHDFFAAWYRGDKGADIAVLERALSDDFRLMSPKGKLVERKVIVDATKQQHAAHPTAAITIKPVQCTQERGLHLSTYEEWQFDDEDKPARLSTAVMSRIGDSWRWFLVHETWLPQGTSAE